MGIAAGIMAASVLLSRLMGLVRDKVISFHYGASLEADIYFASFVIPDFINYLLAGGYFSITLIPLLAERFEADETDGWKLFSAVTLWVGLVATLLTGIAMLFAPQLAALAAPGFDADSTARLARFLRIILPAQVFFLIGSCVTALLYMRRQFAVPALTPLAYNGAIILGGLLMIDHGMEGFCWGVLGGALFGNLILPLVAAVRGGGVRWRLTWRHGGVKRFALLALPLMIGQSVVVLDEQLLRVFGSLADEGAVSRLNYARRIMLVPVGVVAQAAGVASYPFLARLAASGEKSRFDLTLNAALRNTLVFLVPLALWMMVVAGPTIRLIFEQGRFGGADAAQTAVLLRIMLAAVFCWGVQQLIGRAFYANQDTLTPSVTGTLAAAASIPAYWWLAREFGAPGIAAASAGAVLLYTVALSLLWLRRHGKGAFAGIPSVLAGSGLLAGAACLPAWLAMRGAASFAWYHPLLKAFMEIALSGTVFALVFLAAGRLLCPSLVNPVIEKGSGIARKLLRR